MTTGILVLIGKKKSLQVRFTNTKGKEVTMLIAEKNLSSSLTQKKHTNIDELEGLEVELEIVNGQPQKVRELGSAFEQPQLSSSQSPQNKSSRTQDRSPNQNSEQLTDKFHNPYNFVPTLPRQTEGTELGDSKPISHGRYHSDYWSGKIAVTLTTKTPLLIPDVANVEKRNNHEYYSIRIDPRYPDKPYLAPTSIKGMLRAAYEAITNSRLSIFVKHEDRLAYRMSARQVDVVPARVERHGEKLFLRLMEEPDIMGYAAKLPRYSRHSPLRYDRSNDLPQHGDSVWARLNSGGKNKIQKSIVTRIRKREENSQPPGNGDWHKGWVCITNQNMTDKKYERVFIENDDDIKIEIEDSTKALWRELIQNYQTTHYKDLENRRAQGSSYDEYLGNEPGQTAWSRHIYEPNAEQLTEGTLCYVEFDDNDEIKALIPVILSRRLYQTPPEKLLDESLQPATNIEKLSPADRVFGWVKQKTGKGVNTSYKGNLRIGQVICTTENPIEHFGENGFPLAILGQPKEQQTRFYTAKDKQGTPLDLGVAKESGYEDTSKGLRGRKVYPHHQGLPSEYWDNPQSARTQRANNGHFQEYRRPKLNSQEQRDDQNRSIKAWVKQDVSFQFNIDITNLSDVELGALLWLLSLPEHHYHRLGGGKPLGFGSVSLAINWEKTDLRKGQDWKAFYSSLFPIDRPNARSAEECITLYKNAVEEAYGNGKNFERISFIAAFCRGAKGFDDKLPIHYPRARQAGQTGVIPPHPEGKAFEWFVANERQEQQFSLPNLVDDGGLPILNAKSDNR